MPDFDITIFISLFLSGFILILFTYGEYKAGLMLRGFYRALRVDDLPLFLKLFFSVSEISSGKTNTIWC